MRKIRGRRARLAQPRDDKKLAAAYLSQIPGCHRTRWLKYPKVKKYELTFLCCAAYAAALILVPHAAYAATDFVATAVTFGEAILTVFGVIVLMTGGYVAHTLQLNERSIIPAIVGMMFALSLCFLGGWYLTTITGGTAAPAIPL